MVVGRSLLADESVEGDVTQTSPGCYTTTLKHVGCRGEPKSDNTLVLPYPGKLNMTHSVKAMLGLHF